MTVPRRPSALGACACRLLSTLMVALLLSRVALASPTINSIRLHASPEKTRLVFDVSEPLDHTLFVLENPLRLVIDLPGSTLAKKARRQPLGVEGFCRDGCYRHSIFVSKTREPARRFRSVRIG